VWAQRNPEAALASASQLKDWTGRYAVDSGLGTWAKADPNAAKAWAKAHDTDKEGKGEGNWHMVSIIGTLAKTDLDTAIAWAQSEPRSNARGEMMTALVRNMEGQRGLEYARSWAQGLPEGPFREGLIRKVAWETTEENPQQSAKWLSSIPNSEGKREALNELVDHWAEKDPNEAGRWLQSFNGAQDMDSPRKAFAWEIRERDPESAVAWAGAITDRKQRDRLMVDLLRDWSRRDKNAAATYMQRNNWAEETQKKVIR
jgi:hypothetical protein